MINSPLITAEHIAKTFYVKTQNIPVLQDVSFDVLQGNFLIIFGPSGCGKSTLLHILLGLEEPTTGSITLDEKNLYANSTEDDRAEFRKQRIGVVYQQSTWIQSLTVIENITFPLLLLGQNKLQALAKGYELLKSVGMEKWAQYFPTELSGGQQQKIALLRAIITNPELIVADEPTGNLDFESGQELMQLLQQLHQKGKTIIMVTHDLEYIKYATNALEMFDGQIKKRFTQAEIKAKKLSYVEKKKKL